MFLQNELTVDRAALPHVGEARALPALLARFAVPAGLRTGFPLALGAPGDGVVPLSEWLLGLAAPLRGGAARMVADNLGRLERNVGEAAGDEEEACARTVLTAASASMLAELTLASAPAEELRVALAELVGRVPAEARLLGYGRQTALRLFRHAACGALAAHRADVLATLARVRAPLVELIVVETDRAPASHTPEAVRASLGAGLADVFDAAALAKLVGHRAGGRGLGERELARARDALRTLEGARLDTMPAVVVCHAGALPPGVDLGPGVRVIATTDPLQAAIEAFDVAGEEVARVFAAARAARLLTRWAYDPARHDALVEGFTWRDMTADELRVLPRVIVLEAAGAVVGDRLARLLAVLRDARPLHVMVEVQPARALHDDALQAELGALAMALDRPYVVQGTPARPEHFFEGARRAIEGAASALFVVTTGFDEDGSAPAVGAWLAAGAAVDSRAHPLFRFEPRTRGSWAGRLDVEGNPQPEAVWPMYPKTDAPGAPRVAFTLADYALLDPACADVFRPQTYDETARSVPIGEWADLDPEAAFERLPTIDAVENGAPTRLVVSSAFAAATVGRGRRWRLLAELAGVGNAFALSAAAEARAFERASASAREAQVQEAHAVELNLARRAAATEAMGRLAEALLSAEPFVPGRATASGPPGDSAPLTTGSPQGSAPAAPAGAAVAVSAPPAVEAAEDPWIDTSLCTTCNDCINLNPLMFAYDGNKQAFIKDASAGTFAQLLAAAEKCPAKCIHAGTPKAT